MYYWFQSIVIFVFNQIYDLFLIPVDLPRLLSNDLTPMRCGCITRHNIWDSTNRWTLLRDLWPLKDGESRRVIPAFVGKFQELVKLWTGSGEDIPRSSSGWLGTELENTFYLVSISCQVLVVECFYKSVQSWIVQRSNFWETPVVPPLKFFSPLIGYLRGRFINYQKRVCGLSFFYLKRCMKCFECQRAQNQRWCHYVWHAWPLVRRMLCCINNQPDY